MKKLLFTIALLTAFTNLCLADTRIPVKITKIFDGDTVQAQIDNNKFIVRLIGIDCYETCNIHRAYKQAYENNLTINEVIEKGKLSKTFLENLYKNNKKNSVYIDFKGIDKYGRALGILYFGDINVNEELLKNANCLKFEYKN